MVYQSPVGARDLLPLDVVQKRLIEDRLEERFERWGYHRIITSTLERLDTLMAGGAIGRSTVIKLQELSEELGLRPELTASIARTAVTRMAGETYPQRLYYNANVFRRTPDFLSLDRQQEFYQAGVELLGAGGWLADAEVLLLLADCLNEVGLRGWRLILGEAGIARSLIATFPTLLQSQIRHCIAHLDRITLENLPLSDKLLAKALLMLDLRGRPGDVLQLLASLVDATQIHALNHLKSLVELLNDRAIPLILDLSLIQTIDYYTGIVFEVVSDTDTETRVVGQGGRYDQLLQLYHPQGKTIPGIGFALNIEDLQQVLLSTHRLPQTTPACNWLVVPQTHLAYAAAFAYAQKLRSATHLVRVEIHLVPAEPEEIRDYARRRRISQIAWINGTEPTIEALT